MSITKTSDSLPVPFLEVPKFDLSVHWKTLLKGSLAGEVVMTAPELNFTVSERVRQDGSSGKSDQSGKEVHQYGAAPDWTVPLKELMPLKINRFEVFDGSLNFKDFTTKPEVNLFIDSIYLLATNLSNVSDRENRLPSTI